MLFFGYSLNAQTFTKLNYDNSKCEFLEITEIKLTKKYTIVYFLLTPSKKGESHFGFCIESQIKLINDDTKAKYVLKKLKGVPKCPTHFFTTARSKPLKFKVYFEKIDDVSASFSIIESENDATQNPFNINNIEFEYPVK